MGGGLSNGFSHIPQLSIKMCAFVTQFTTFVVTHAPAQGPHCRKSGQPILFAFQWFCVCLFVYLPNWTWPLELSLTSR